MAQKCAIGRSSVIFVINALKNHSVLIRFGFCSKLIISFRHTTVSILHRLTAGFLKNIVFVTVRMMTQELLNKFDTTFF